MTELDAALVRRKLATMLGNLTDLATVEGLSLAEYRADRFRHKGTERLLQESIEAAVDINLHVLRARGVEVPSDYYDSFVALGRHGIISQSLAERLAPAAGLRNRLVHEYDAIDDAIVLKAVATARRDFAEYIAAQDRALTELGR
ncbi:MAG: DUF86 domain-containing protein [Gemmatimonadetes bacterium]|nr:DUF86 domain-containing protein [Gemmatimonadota bacterium]